MKFCGAIKRCLEESRQTLVVDLRRTFDATFDPTSNHPQYFSTNLEPGTAFFLGGGVLLPFSKFGDFWMWTFSEFWNLNAPTLWITQIMRILGIIPGLSQIFVTEVFDFKSHIEKFFSSNVGHVRSIYISSCLWHKFWIKQFRNKCIISELKQWM